MSTTALALIVAVVLVGLTVLVVLLLPSTAPAYEERQDSSWGQGFGYASNGGSLSRGEFLAYAQRWDERCREIFDRLARLEATVRSPREKFLGFLWRGVALLGGVAGTLAVYYVSHHHGL